MQPETGVRETKKEKKTICLKQNQIQESLSLVNHIFKHTYNHWEIVYLNATQKFWYIQTFMPAKTMFFTA